MTVSADHPTTKKPSVFQSRSITGVLSCHQPGKSITSQSGANDMPICTSKKVGLCTPHQPKLVVLDLPPAVAAVATRDRTLDSRLPSTTTDSIRLSHSFSATKPPPPHSTLMFHSTVFLHRGGSVYQVCSHSGGAEKTHTPWAILPSNVKVSLHCQVV